jgi:single-strand DNA-binding protein
MASFNRVILAGNLTRDPEIRFTNDGVPVTNFGLAVNRVRSTNDAVDFFDVTAWRELGEAVANHKSKGDPVLIEGRLRYRTWEAQDGSRRSKVDVVADHVQFLGKGGGSSSNDGEGSFDDFEEIDEEPEPAPGRPTGRKTRKGRGNRAA